MSILKGQLQTVNYLEFDGVDDRVSVSHDSSLNLTSEMTLSATVELDEIKTQSIFNKNQSSPGYELSLSTFGPVIFRFNGQPSSLDLRGGNLSPNELIHITGTYDGSIMRLYIDGVEVSNMSVSGAINTNNDNLVIGARNDLSSAFFNGEMYNIQIWNKALTSTEINNFINTPPTGNETGLVAYYKFDEGSGTTLNDSAGTNDATIYGATWDSEQFLPEIQNIYKGTTEISKVFKGNTLVFQSVVSYIAATGGTTTTYEDNGTFYKSHTFTSSGNFVVNSLGTVNNELDYLIIAGGGGGGARNGGGGGAGGYRTTLGTSGGNSSAESKITANAQSYTITVGAGGNGSTSDFIAGENGTNTSALGITSTGGGGGGSREDVLEKNGENGGSGGGGASNFGNGGNGTANQGFDGGDGEAGNSATTRAGAGGGGAGSDGVDAIPGKAGNGGSGLGNILRNGTNERRAGGGGGGTNTTNVIDNGIAVDGGGDGGEFTQNGDNATVNTGGGGGGGANVSGAGFNFGGNGGSGIVIIRYEVGGL